MSDARLPSVYVCTCMGSRTNGVYIEGIDDRPSRWRHRAIPNAIGYYREEKNDSRVNPPGTAVRVSSKPQQNV